MCILLAATAALLAPGRSFSRPPLAVPLGAQVRWASHVFVLRAETLDVGTGVVTFARTADLKGRYGAPTWRCRVGRGGQEGPNDLLRWARRGERAVCFLDGNQAYVCLGNAWFSAEVRNKNLWMIDWDLPHFALTWCGRVEQLVEHVQRIVAGRETTITARSPEIHFVLGFGERPPGWLYGRKHRVWRIKASLAITELRQVHSVFSRHFVGWGAGGPGAVAGLVRSLKHPDERVRSEAAFDLGELGATARAAVPALRQALADPDGPVRLLTAEALLRIDPAGRQALPVLAAALAARDADLRRTAVEVVGARRPAARAVLPGVIERLARDPVGEVRVAAARALGEWARQPEHLGKKDAARIIAALGQVWAREADRDALLQAFESLARWGRTHRSALPHLAAALKDLRPQAVGLRGVLARFGTAGGYGLWQGPPADIHTYTLLSRVRGMGSAARPLAPAVLPLLHEGESGVWWSAAETLIAIDPDGAGLWVVAALAYRASAGDMDLESLTCIWALGQCGGSPASVAALRRLLKHKDEVRRACAAKQLGQLGRKAAAAAADLVAALNDAEQGVRLKAALALVRIGRPGKAVAVLVRAMNDGCGDALWEQAVGAFAEAGPAARLAVPLLGKALAEKNVRKRLHAAGALWHVGRPVRRGAVVFDPRQRALRVLLDTASDPTADHWRLAARLLGRIGPAAAAATPALVRVARDCKDQQKQEQALDTLGALGRAGRGAEPVLQALLRDEQPDVRLAAARALWRVHPHHPLVVPAVLEIARWCPCHSGGAAELLAEVGPDARPAVPWLLHARREDDGLFEAATRALAKIDPDAARKAGQP
jgi:HEAT repeat protein